jgi:hypothetical protein
LRRFGGRASKVLTCRKEVFGGLEPFYDRKRFQELKANKAESFKEPLKKPTIPKALKKSHKIYSKLSQQNQITSTL